MKKDLLIAAGLVILAALGVGLIVVLPFLQKEDEQITLAKPRPEPIAELPTNPDPPRRKEPVKKGPVKLAWNEKKKGETKAPKIVVEPVPEPKKEPEVKKDLEPKKEPEPKKDIEPKKEPEKKAVVKIEPKVKVIEFDPLTFLNNPDGEYTVKPLYRGKQIELIGKIKTLKIASLSENSVIDASKLVAEEIIFLQDVNNSRVILGKTQKLTIRDVNDKSVVDASAAEASVIILAGSINSRSTVKLHAPKGTVEIVGQVNDHSRVEIVAPNGNVLFKNQGSAINEGQVNIEAKDVEMRGPINGGQTLVNVTLSKGGSLKFVRMNGAARFHWHKADANDPEPRIDAGEIGRTAQFRMAPALKK